MNRILKKEVLTPSIKLFEIETPLIADKVLPGQFVVTIAYEQGERIPLTVADIDKENSSPDRSAYISEQLWK